MEKVCQSCGQTKSSVDFYKHPTTADGLLRDCKECKKAYEKAKRHDPRYRDSILAYDRARGSRQSKEYIKEYRARFPNKYRAHTMVNNAVRSGKLFPEPCCVHGCGRTDTVEGHHDDYSKPLNVRWMCSAHHKQWHAENGEAKNP